MWLNKPVRTKTTISCRTLLITIHVRPKRLTLFRHCANVLFIRLETCSEKWSTTYFLWSLFLHQIKSTPIYVHEGKLFHTCFMNCPCVCTLKKHFVSVLLQTVTQSADSNHTSQFCLELQMKNSFFSSQSMAGLFTKIFRRCKKKIF